MRAQQLQRFRIMGLDGIDRQMHALRYFLIGKFITHFHYTDFTFLRRQLVQRLIKQWHQFLLLQILYQRIFIFGRALRYLIILCDGSILIADYIKNMVLRHRHQIVLQTDTYAKFRTELPETGKDMLHRILCHGLVHQVAISQYIKQLMILFIDHGKRLHVSPLYPREKCFIIHIRC